MIGKRALGTQGLRVAALGLGCGGMSPARGLPGLYGPPDEAECLATIQRAIDLGVELFDTAEMYGPYHNEELLGRAIRGRRERVVLSTKFGFRYDAQGSPHVTDSSPAHVRRSVEGSLKRLGVDCIDLIYQHRIDRDTPIEETVGAMAALVRDGKARYIGLSEVGPATIRRAHAVHPLSVIETEYSLWEREPEREILPTLRSLGIGFVPYAPLGRGFLAASAGREQVNSDARKAYPRFQGENYDRNLSLLEKLKAFAARKSATPAQVSLAWLLAKGDDIVPIPGTKRRKYLEENVAAAALRLERADIVWLDREFAPGVAAGARYSDVLDAYVDR